MKKTELVKTISLIDEIYKNRGRQNFIGTIITGVGLTITALGIMVFTNKPRHDFHEKDEEEESVIA